MSDLVSARIAPEIRRQGNEVLAQLGSTPSELIRSAYEYVIAKRQLPGATSDEAGRGGDAPDAASLDALVASIAESTVSVPSSAWDAIVDGDYKGHIAASREADYEALA
ncbi:type II toxin-antitoxin system RelB/DinJ family antitoxin [Enorma burkinafasonensis]|uniref:type II toxin-antitoxin system RelB/DinJ family antitoxin n=1 Tax=Enorma burkinafasonensis TaxID=2590867 RepID=UPI0026EBA7F9|nr:type II toxin-antitoxin system RelB/DinJ family antitoxin [Enorma burkinafasonensis]MCI7730506.1 type II toxin-antitoxin system RelB/DinJ family antitoxin [Enorma burkinafasonensis]